MNRGVLPRPDLGPGGRRAFLRSLTLSLAGAGALARLDGVVLGQEPPAAGAEGVDFQEITPELEKAVEKGLVYLAAQQQADGSFGLERYGRHAGITALAGLAFMSHGDLPGRGPWSRQVELALDFVLDQVQPSGLVAADASHGPMYGHGFATLFLAEIYGQTQDSRVREDLRDHGRRHGLGARQ